MPGRRATFAQLMCGCAIVLAATTASAGEADRIRRDTPYADARKALLADGFLPARIGACSAPAREEICITFPEAQMCAGTGFAECEFAFRRPDGATVRIVTRGEMLKDRYQHDRFALANRALRAAARARRHHPETFPDRAGTADHCGVRGSRI